MKIMPADNLLASSTPNYTQLASERKLMRPHARKQTWHDGTLAATVMVAVTQGPILPLGCAGRDGGSG